jgi:hypothetical protein
MFLDAFLTECIAVLIEQLRQHDQSNGDMFAAPKHQVELMCVGISARGKFQSTSALDVFTSTQIYDWGSGPRGEPDMGTFTQIIQPKMLEVLNAPNMETYCDNLTKVLHSPRQPIPTFTTTIFTNPAHRARSWISAHG